MTIVRCLGCRTTFDEPIGYLGHDCKSPTVPTVEDALLRVEQIFDTLEDAIDSYEAAVAAEKAGSTVEIVVGEDPDALGYWADVDDDEDPFFGPDDWDDDLSEPYWVRAAETALVVGAAVSLVALLAYDKAVDKFRRVIGVPEVHS